MASAQYYGKAAILKAYDDRGLPVWSLCEGKELRNAGDDRADLAGFLDSLGITNATYKLCFYGPEIENASEIDRNTPYVSCYNVKLMEQDAGVPARMAGTGYLPMDPILGAVHAHFMKKVASAVEKELEAKEEPEDETIGSMFKGLLKELIKSPQALSGTIDALGRFVAQLKGGGVPAALGSTNPPLRAGTMAGTEGEQQPAGDDGAKLLQRMQAAINILGQCDPEFVPHLEKLAQIAQTKPMIYKMAIAQLSEL